MKAVIVIVIVAILGVGGWVIYDKNHKSTPTNSYSSSSASTTSSHSSSQTAKSSEVITTRTSASLGKYLADGNGRTLYNYGADTAGVSNCSGSCVTTWPVYKAATTTSLPASVTTIKRSDGATQYAYKGLPLYYFITDTQPGQVSGNGVGNFRLVKP